MQTHYDTIVVGAGIEGSATAHALAVKGRKTLLLEQVLFQICAQLSIALVPATTFTWQLARTNEGHAICVRAVSGCVHARLKVLGNNFRMGIFLA
jgi:choline dehydrogenase-like flavoprotein